MKEDKSYYNWHMFKEDVVLIENKKQKNENNFILFLSGFFMLKYIINFI